MRELGARRGTAGTETVEDPLDEKAQHGRLRSEDRHLGPRVGHVRQPGADPGADQNRGRFPAASGRAHRCERGPHPSSDRPPGRSATLRGLEPPREPELHRFHVVHPHHVPWVRCRDERGDPVRPHLFLGHRHPRPGRTHQVRVRSQSGAFVASSPALEVDTKFGGARSFFSGEGLFLLKISGTGDLIFSSVGAIHTVELAVGEVVTVDTSHMVGFSGGVSYAVRKVGNWKSTLLGGEGLVCDFTGPGILWIQTRSPQGMAGWSSLSSPAASSNSRPGRALDAASVSGAAGGDGHGSTHRRHRLGAGPSDSTHQSLPVDELHVVEVRD